MIDYKYVEEIVRRAGELIRVPISLEQIHTKGYADFVTDKDMEVQQFIYESLNKMYPKIGFMGEEENTCSCEDTEFMWILDPIDGTTNFIYGYKLSAISLALKHNDNIEFGIVYNPFTDELFKAIKGQGACLNDKPIKVSMKGSMKESIVAVGTSPYFKELADDTFEKITKIFKQSLDIRRTGSAAIDLAYVAAGRQDAYFEYNLKPWDCAAGCLLVEEAGGVLMSIDGGRVEYGKNANVLACCCEKIAGEMRTILNAD